MVPFEVGLGFLSSLSSSKGEPRSSLMKGLRGACRWWF